MIVDVQTNSFASNLIINHGLHMAQTVIVKPVADAGSDKLVNSNDIVQLDGSDSSGPNNSPLTYFWNQTSGPKVTLSEPTSPYPTLQRPKQSNKQILHFN